MTINEFNLEIDTDKIIKDLQRLIRIPSVSAKSQKFGRMCKRGFKNYARNWDTVRINLF